jgi:hypothetical protein
MAPKVRAALATEKLAVIPAKAGFSTAELVIHLDLGGLIEKQNGFPLSRE